MKRFADQVAFITGGARGIGRATAERLADEGATVVLGDVDGKALEVTSRQLGAIAAHRNVDTVIIDVSDAAAVEQTARDLIKRHGRLDVLVNNAGILRDNWIDCLTDDDWQAVIGVHLTGAFNCTRSVVPH
ncbi:MAG: SDR family NAD(P)-dependent oxidoreductase, partial [Acidobacteriota bacterium]